MYDICVEDFMVRDVKYIWNRMTFQQLKDLLKENKVNFQKKMTIKMSFLFLLSDLLYWLYYIVFVSFLTNPNHNIFFYYFLFLFQFLFYYLPVIQLL